MERTGYRGFVRHAAAVGVVLLLLPLAQLLAASTGRGSASLLFLPAVAATSFWLGKSSGFLATALSAVLVAVLRAEAPWWRVESLVELALFLVGGASLATLAGRHRTVRDVGAAGVRAIAFETERGDRARQDRIDGDARLQAILDTAIEGIVSIDEHGNVESLNAAAERLFGYRAEEVVGRNVNMLMPSPYGEEHDGYLAAYRRTGERKIIGSGREVQGKRKDGSVFPIDLAVSEVQLGERRTFTGFIRDLTEKKRLEAEFLRAQKMEAIGGLAGGIAHDFNNLLMGILAFSRMAREERDPAATREAFDEIGGAANRGIALTRRLLAFTRGRPAELAPTRIDAVMQENEAMLRQLLGEDIALRVRPSNSGACILADEGLIEQILVNLLINARDAMPSGGEIVVTIRDVEGPPERVVLEVRDSGSGMSADVRGRIFEPFFTTKDPAKGTGLGLSTVKRIVDQLRGSIEVESEPGRGTTFQLSFPRSALATGGKREPAPLRRRRSERSSVLVVEDDRLVRYSIRRYLEGQGYQVVAADGPSEALASVRTNGDIDVLLTDMVMPGTGGNLLAREVLALAPSARVIYMSAHPSEYLLERKQLEPGATYLQKPFELEELSQLLSSVLRSSEPVAPAHPHERT